MKKEAIGFCKNWNQEKGFGFIQLLEGVDTGKTVFLHYSVMYSFYHKVLVKDEMVTVAYEQGEKGLKAVDCWSNVYGYTKGKSFREFTDNICDVVFDYHKLCVPKENMYKYRQLKTLEEYKSQVTNIEAVKRNIETLLSYNGEYTDGWFSQQKYTVTFEKLSDEPKEHHYNKNKEIEFVMRDFETGLYIYKVSNYGNFDIEEYWKQRKAIPSSFLERFGDGTGLFPQWEADGFDE